MLHQLAAPGEALAALGTLVGLEAGVRSYVELEPLLQGELLAALVALEDRPLAMDDLVMVPKAAGGFEPGVADHAAVLLRLIVLLLQVSPLLPPLRPLLVNLVLALAPRTFRRGRIFAL
ncbi:hypothetical protein KM043_007728 [Ampulex compressa]|nr:hypothetical protein KM043_007728 [Ampulex compressa]